MRRTDREISRPRRPSFLSGVFLLSLSAMLVKVTGLLTKIPLLRLLGAEGMGYYNTAYEVYAFLFVLSTAGLPVALSILVSEGRDGSGRVLRVACRLFALIGGAGAALLWFGAAPLSALMGNAGAEASMRAVAPAVLFICLSAAVRGYYQGLQNMMPTAVSQLLEAVGKLGFGLLFASLATRRALPLPRVAAAGAMGLSAGTLLSLLYLLLFLSAHSARDRGKDGRRVSEPAQAKRPAQRILGRLLAIAVPITLSSGVITLTRLLDMVLILRRLRGCGYTEAAVNVLYGAYSTLAVPLYSLLPALIGSVALPLVPGIARAREVGDLQGEREIVSASFRLTLLLALPASMGLSVFARPILTLLFGAGEGAVAQASPLLTLLGASVLGACLMTVTGAMLQAYHRPHLPLLSMLVGSAVKLTAAWFLLGWGRVGMLGAPISTFLCNLTVVLLDLAFLAPLIPRERSVLSFAWRTFGASLLSVGMSYALWYVAESRLILPRPAPLVAVALCFFLYLLLILRMGALQWEDVARFSFGARLWVVLERLHLIKSGEKVVNFHR